MKTLDADKLIFIDETGVNTSMARDHGWAPCGSPVIDYKPGRQGSNITVVGAIRRDRVLCHETMSGSLNKERWRKFVRTRLVPRLTDDDVVLLDNLRIHKDAESIAMIEEAGAHVLFLPPYSPDMNAIEFCWAYIKRVLRRLRERDEGRMKRAVWRALMTVTTPILESWFRHVGVQVN